MRKNEIRKVASLQGLAFIFVLCTTPIVKASVPTHTVQAGSGSLQATRDALELPMNERVSQLQADSHSYENLKSLMFGKGNPMDLRWKAVTAIGRMGGAKAKTDLAQALSAPEWFMRNAGLIAMSNLDPTESLIWARKLLTDKALVVRVAAVDIISKTQDNGNASLLWNKLYAKENYRNGQSLFIRRRIVEALAAIDGKGHEAKFVALLQDKDRSLQEPAMQALARITRHTIGRPNDSLQTRREQWQQWYQSNKAAL